MTDERTTFPYTLNDLLYWVIKRKDGTMIKFVYQDPATAGVGKVIVGNPHRAPTYPSSSYSSTHKHEHSSVSQWCDHKPELARPSFVSEDGKVSLYVADAWGIKDTCDLFDLVLDCGDVLTPRYLSSANPIIGDSALVKLLKSNVEKYEVQNSVKFPKRVLQLHWIDRAAPRVDPEFWVKLSKVIKGKVATNCQGGHGRSGTSFVCLLMTLAPDYDAKDAIIHLRANHCPRAIESAVQHEYIDKVATYLGRKANAAEVKGINNYVAEFKAMTKPTAERYRALKAEMPAPVGKGSREVTL